MVNEIRNGNWKLEMKWYLETLFLPFITLEFHGGY